MPLFVIVLSKTGIIRSEPYVRTSRNNIMFGHFFGWKKTTGSTDNLDSEDWKKIKGVKEGFAQYYKIEQSLGPNYLNSGRVLEKVGFNDKKEAPEKEPLKFVVIDRRAAFKQAWS